jgi:hypothetical protein
MKYYLCYREIGVNFADLTEVDKENFEKLQKLLREVYQEYENVQSNRRFNNSDHQHKQRRIEEALSISEKSAASDNIILCEPFSGLSDMP